MTDLDRLLEIYRNFGNMDSDFISLKSQIESKLAQADKFEALLQFIPKNSDGYATIECIFCKRGHHEDCIGAPQSCCCGFWENKVDTPEQQELAQLRSIVQALRDKLEEYQMMGIPCSLDESTKKMHIEQDIVIKEFKSILANSDQTYYVEMINPSGKITLYTDNTYTTHHTECKCDKCSEVKQ